MKAANVATETCSSISRRSPDLVMRLNRLGAFHRTRLSFMDSLLRRLSNEGWRFHRTLWDIDKQGHGRAVYSVHGPDRSYSLVCFSHDLPDDMRSDRVIATAWDATFTLFDGEPREADLVRLAANVPRQEAGRVSNRELSLSRANRSVRLFGHVVERLAAGQQPDPAEVEAVGYLMRTTAVYGSGKFGAADRSEISGRRELSGPFQAEMLSVWLIRAFTMDLVEHLAQNMGGETAVRLEPELRRRFGIGNSTGLGMAPFLVNHPVLLNNWIAAREEALVRVRQLPEAHPEKVAGFESALAAALENARNWTSEHPIQIEKLEALRSDLDALASCVAGFPFSEHRPWDRLWQWAETTLSTEGQEALVSLLVEPYGDIVDDLADTMAADEEAAFRIDGSMSLSDLVSLIRERYRWALEIDYDTPENCARFWYVSEEKLEPRLGQRHEEPGSDFELPLATGRDVKHLLQDLQQWSGDTKVADFLTGHPEHRHSVRRVQLTARFPYAEIRDNLISADLLPIDLLRCKLSFFGASRFDPRSDRWVRICMYQDAPYPHELLPAVE